MYLEICILYIIANIIHFSTVNMTYINEYAEGEFMLSS